MPYMDLVTALNIVLDLAEQSVIDEEDLPEENARQLEAIRLIIEHRKVINIYRERILKLENRNTQAGYDAGWP